jgi:putative heme-binding domain-containing protein
MRNRFTLQTSKLLTLFMAIKGLKRAVICALSVFLAADQNAMAAESPVVPTADDYNQWRQALGKPAATDPATFKILPGFKVELLHSATREEGSWVSLTFDAKGRLLIGREGAGLLRSAVPATHMSRAKPIAFERVNRELKECRGLLWAFDSLYANANNSKAFYRLRDTNGDDQFDDVQLLRATPGEVGHGRNAMVLGPDNFIYLIHGNDTHLPTDFQIGNSPFRNYGEDQLLPCAWNSTLFNAGTKAPAGHVIRTDAEGRRWELIAGGFRNPYGIDFHPDGEMFTYDADMEWDIGAPWYRPTRVNHIVSGADYGWRQGTDKWPAYFPDSVPSNGDIGPGSPTAVRFGTRSHFPEKYRRAFFICDWAYGRILAVHLKAQGASYIGEPEIFLKGRPLNVTDLVFGSDGAMYFITGGRGTQTGLYKVTATASERMEMTAAEKRQEREAARARALRRQLESWHGRVDAKAVAASWKYLDAEDHWIRQAARIALEHQPVQQWRQRALKEKRTTAALTALLALARVGPADSQEQLLRRLFEFQFESLSEIQQLHFLRAAELSFIRMGRPSMELQTLARTSLEKIFPRESTPVNQELAKLLVYLASDVVPQRVLAMLDRAATQEEKLHYLFLLRLARHGWTSEWREKYFRWLDRADGFQGGHYIGTFIRNIKSDALAAAPSEDRADLQALWKSAERPSAVNATAPRAMVREWQMVDLESALGNVSKGRDLIRGKQLFQTAQCAACHKFQGEGGNMGPDLSEVAARFDRRTLLESILAPSVVIDDKYRNTVLQLKDGEVIEGRIVQESADSVHVAANPLAPNDVRPIELSKIAVRQPSMVSPMPAGLLNHFTREEILDLLAFLESSIAPPRATSGN